MHAYVDALEKLQGRLDAIATEDKVEVREKRRDVVRAIERELQRVDEWKRKVIRDADPSGRGSVSGSDRWNV